MKYNLSTPNIASIPSDSPARNSRRRSKSLGSLGLLLLLFVSSGASCVQMCNWTGMFCEPTPQILPPNPSLQSIITQINQNIAQVHTIDIDHATLRITGAPMSLNSQIHIQRPRQFRMKASASLTGSEVDLGSNNELFWLWIRRSEPKGIYYAKHEEFSSSQMGKILPVPPEKIIEAFGLVTLDPAAHHLGPTPAGPNRLSIQTELQTAEGIQKIVTIVDSRSAWVLEQKLYNAQGSLVASVVNRNFEKDITSGAWLPKQIEMIWPATGSTLSIFVHQIAVNQPEQYKDHFQMPKLEGYPAIHLGSLTPPNISNTTPANQANRMMPSNQAFGGRNSQSGNQNPRTLRPTINSIPPNVSTSVRQTSGWYDEPPK